MLKTYTISRADLKAQNYKSVAIQQSGTVPEKRNIDLLVKVLKKAINK